MNVKQLQKQLRTNLRLRPFPVRQDASGSELETLDDFWRLEELFEDPARARLVNIHTGHSVVLQSDNIKEYRSPDFLLLRCRLVITPTTVGIEPLFDSDDTFVRLEHQMPALLAEMRQDLKGGSLKREIILLKRSWTYWGKGTELVYYFDEHPDLMSQLQILENHQLVADITYNNTTRYQMSEKLARYLGA